MNVWVVSNPRNRLGSADPFDEKPEKCLYSLLAIVRTEGGPMYTDTHTHMRIFTYTNTENQTTIWIWYNWAGGTQPLSTCVGLFRQPVRSLVGAWIGRPAPQERRPYVTIVQSLAFYPSQKDQPNTFEYLQSPSIFIYLFHNKSLLFFFLL